MDKKRPTGEQNLVAWARPYLNDRRRLYQLVDPRLGLNYSIKGVQKVAQICHYCLSRDGKSRPSMDEVVKQLTPLQDLNYTASASFRPRSSQRAGPKTSVSATRPPAQSSRAAPGAPGAAPGATQRGSLPAPGPSRPPGAGGSRAPALLAPRGGLRAPLPFRGKAPALALLGVVGAQGPGIIGNTGGGADLRV
ncbi:hypothetical protein PR202_gb08064 [Eleusine coracana subsp. coracana]|uniref:Uncharacterized protein n=1 Tax=Eleusine coracana subsp. coracana TaxID=191504 RepID=A0AAV5EE65_ELECO|nr:hypothetical protein PR202_gb08064 [Eleusine coracana subsp. coracana]